MDIQILGIFLMFSFLIVAIVLFMVHRVFGCRISCWSHGVRIRTRSKQKKKKKLNKRDRYKSAYTTSYSDHDNEDTVNDGHDDYSVSVENIERFCCLTLTWTQDEDKEIIVPNSSQVTYGAFQTPPLLNCRQYCTCCFNKTKRFPRQPKNDTCPICLDSFTDKMALILLECSHGYHDTCLTDWLRSKDTNYVECPFCKHGMHIEGFSRETGELLKYQALPYVYGYHSAHIFANTVTYL